MADTGPTEGFLTRWLKSQAKPKDKKKDPNNPGTTPKPKPKQKSTFDKIKEGYTIFKGLGKEKEKK